VSDIDKSVAFYRDQVGFDLDHDTRTDQMHVVQLTPPGSGCSIVLGDLPAHREMAPGSMRGLQLVVADVAIARQELLDRGVEASEIVVFDERDGGTFFGFSDPDGNTWSVQQIKTRADKPLIPMEARGRFGEGMEL
jgi:catechol 2,3-dioxygenase-like lactoylglutathione lyase family enzyme